MQGKHGIVTTLTLHTADLCRLALPVLRNACQSTIVHVCSLAGAFDPLTYDAASGCIHRWQRGVLVDNAADNAICLSPQAQASLERHMQPLGELLLAAEKADSAALGAPIATAGLRPVGQFRPGFPEVEPCPVVDWLAGRLCQAPLNTFMHSGQCRGVPPWTNEFQMSTMVRTVRSRSFHQHMCVARLACPAMLHHVFRLVLALSRRCGPEAVQHCCSDAVMSQPCRHRPKCSLRSSHGCAAAESSQTRRMHYASSRRRASAPALLTTPSLRAPSRRSGSA